MMIFNKFPEDSVCPVCKTAKQTKCTVITNEDGKLEPFHIDCIDLKYFSDRRILAMRF